MRTTILLGATTAFSISFGLAGPASALSMNECSTKYQAAKQAGATTSWNDFRKAECGTIASATPATAAPATTTASRPGPAVPTQMASPARAKPALGPTVSTGTIRYPSAVDPKYAKESAGKARMHTCLDGCNAAKAPGTLADMKWIQRGGGYYSTCNTRLKS